MIRTWTTAAMGVALVVAVVSAQRPPSPLPAFYEAIRNDDRAALAALLREHGPNVQDVQRQTPLMFAAAFGSVEVLRTLLEAGADVAAANGSGATALHWAVGEPAKVRLLLDRDTDPDARSELGRTPLVVAASTHGTVEVVRMLLARGAAVNMADSTGVTPLIAAAGVDDMQVAALLLERGADVNTRASVPHAATALMGAASNGNAKLTRMLLARRAEVDATSAPPIFPVKNGMVQFASVTALHLAVTGRNADVVEQLLAAGATVDPLDARGMTPAMWAVATDRPHPRILELLFDRGADVSLRSTQGQTTTDWAHAFGNPLVLSRLKLTATGGPSVEAVRAADVGRGTPRGVVEHSLPLLRTASTRMLTDGGCVACHAQPLTAIAVELTRARGWDAGAPGTELLEGTASMNAAAPMMLQAREMPGQTDAQLYNALMMAFLDAPSSPGTDALVHYLAGKQRAAGHWSAAGATRAPMQDGDVSRTALAVRALTAYAPPARRMEMRARVERAARWLDAQTPVTTEERIMQLLGLHWADAGAPTRERRVRDLLDEQRADGGWAQTPHLASDAYATGQALFTLRTVGVANDDPVLQRGIAFLVRTQQDDGSWHVRSRAMKIQPYFESGFPYGHDQWISHAASAWAVMALSAVH